MVEMDNGVSWLHRFGSFVAVMTFLLYMTGVPASSTGEGLFDPRLGNIGYLSPDSPNKYAQIFMVLAIAVGVLIVTLAFWLWRSNSPRYLKILGVVTVGVFLLFALVLLSPARRLFPTAVTFWYTCGIQIFFCLTVCLALFTRTDWRWDEPKEPDLKSPSMRQILVFTTTAVFVEPILGEGIRRKAIGIAPHLVLGIAILVCSLWVLEMALNKFSYLRAFKISAVFLAEVAGLQLFFGIISYCMNLNARAVPGPHPGLAVMNVTHAALGVLVLATSLFATCQGFKYFAPAGHEAAPTMIR